MLASRDRVRELAQNKSLFADWISEVRPSLLWAAGLWDNKTARPGEGYTGHAFADSNHCDATTMLGEVAHNQNSDGSGKIAGIAVGNRLGAGIEKASLPELGEGGSWSTCTNGCHLDPPQDVAHVQFRSRIAFKLVWAPPSCDGVHFHPGARRGLPTTSGTLRIGSSSSCSSTTTASCWRRGRRRARFPRARSGSATSSWLAAPSTRGRPNCWT